MRISDEMIFPHPVVANWRDDFDDACFDVEITYREDKKTGRLELAVKSRLDCSEIEALVKEDTAAFGCFVLCRSTGLRRLVELEMPMDNYVFKRGDLLDTVTLRPLVWTKKNVDIWQPSGVHIEFQGDQVLRRGDVVALASEFDIQVNQADLPALETIFQMKAVDSMEPGEFDIDLDKDKITIIAARETYDLIETLRATGGAASAAVMNSLYVPAMMKVFSQISSDSGDPQLAEFEGKRWVVPFKRRCTMLEIHYENARVLENALRVLERPFGQLAELAGGADAQ